MGTIYLLRHGRTKANELWLYCGRTDLPLSLTGKAEVAAKRDAGVYPASSAERICLTSGMLRTEQTFATIYGDMPHRQVPGLAEMDFGDWEMCAWEDVEGTPEFKRWYEHNDGSVPCPGGESSNDMKQRVLAAWKGEVLPLVAGSSAEVLVVAHGGTIAIVMADAFPHDGRSRFEWQPGPGLGFRISTDDAGMPVSYDAIAYEEPAGGQAGKENSQEDS